MVLLDGGGAGQGADAVPAAATPTTRRAIMTVTADLRAELEAKGVEVPLPDEEMTALSRQLNLWLEEKRMRDDHTMQSSSWFNLWTLLDDDGSNDIEFEELNRVVRQRLMRGQSDLSDEKLKALWVTLDADGNSFLLRDEVAAFLKRGTLERAKTVQRLASHKSVGFDQMDGYDDNPLGRAQAGAASSTAQMRQELAERGIDLPQEAEITHLSRKFNLWLEEKRMRDDHTMQSNSWFDLWKLLDDDGSDDITFDELSRVLRQRLLKGQSDLSDDQLKALCACIPAALRSPHDAALRHTMLPCATCHLPPPPATARRRSVQSA